MGQVLRPAALVPPGLGVDSIVMEDIRTVITDIGPLNWGWSDLLLGRAHCESN